MISPRDSGLDKVNALTRGVASATATNDSFDCETYIIKLWRVLSKLVKRDRDHISKMGHDALVESFIPYIMKS